MDDENNKPLSPKEFQRKLRREQYLKAKKRFEDSGQAEKARERQREARKRAYLMSKKRKLEYENKRLRESIESKQQTLFPPEPDQEWPTETEERDQSTQETKSHPHSPEKSDFVPSPGKRNDSTSESNANVSDEPEGQTLLPDSPPKGRPNLRLIVNPDYQDKI